MCLNNCRQRIVPILGLVLAVLFVGCQGTDKSGDGSRSGQQSKTFPYNVEISSVEGVSIVRCGAGGGSVVWPGTTHAAELADIIHEWCDFEGCLITEADLPQGYYNITVKPGKGEAIWPLAKKAFEDVFGLSFVEGKETVDILVLQKGEKHPRGLIQVAQPLVRGMNHRAGVYSVGAGSMEDIANIISEYFDDLVIDETGLTGFYRFTLAMDDSDPNTMFPAVERLGLKLVRTKRELPVMRVAATPEESPASAPASAMETK